MKKILILAALISLNSFAYLSDSDEMRRIGQGSTITFNKDVLFTNNSYEVYFQEGRIVSGHHSLDKEKLFCVLTVTKQRRYTRKIEAGRIMTIWRTSSMGGNHLFSANFELDDKGIDYLSCNRWYNFFWPTIGDLKETLGDLMTIELDEPSVIFDPMEFGEEVVNPREGIRDL